jgi:hypothetical protein
MTQSKSSEHLNLPDLRLIPTESLVLHEFADEKRVARLEQRLRTDGYLKSPPIVAPIPGGDRFVVLDGANRTSALARIGCPHALVQVVDYGSEQVQLFTWHHLITGRPPETFLQEIKSVEGLVVETASLDEARAALNERWILAYVVSPQGDGAGEMVVYTLDGIPGTEHHTPENSTVLLNATVGTYKSDPKVAIHRVNSDDLAELMPYYDDVSGLVVFPSYSPDDILKLAQTGVKVPTGITRHIISPRALRVNVPIALLYSSDSLEVKNAWWHDQLKRKLASNEIRLYQESTYLFDE